MIQIVGQQATTFNEAAAQAKQADSASMWWIVGGMLAGFVVGQLVTGGRMGALLTGPVKPMVMGLGAAGALGGYLVAQREIAAAQSAMQQNIGQ